MRSALEHAWRFAATLMGWAVFVLVCAAWELLVILPTRLVARFHPQARERFSDWTRAALRVYIGCLPFMRLRVERAARPLEGPRILVANHQSWLDPIVLISLEPRVRGPARGYLFRVPVLRSVLELAGFFEAEAGEPAPLDRMRRDAEEARRSGSGLLFFPEGSRSRTGEVGPFQRGAFRLAVDHDLPIQPIVIEGLDRVLPPGRVIAQARGRYLVRVRYLEPVFPPYGAGIRRDVVRALTERVRSSIATELARLRAERPTERSSRSASAPRRPAAPSRNRGADETRSC